ncbi:SPOR domain-containing protein [Gynuella sunshinyii]|uniref:Cell division protein n=1 Tax=Gynuella sunshinyii YC6258 TaxID=1445510 RepID=A0A0C5VRM8_9GAMM|nr:hypothetical protein [Gynuella sunshinyii]AJQ96891.1 cell division protein [Gynuella sunshinyii YC6258]
MKTNSCVLVLLFSAASVSVGAASIGGVGVGVKGQVTYSDISNGTPGVGVGLVFGNTTGVGPRFDATVQYLPSLQYDYDGIDVEHALLYSDIGVDWPFLKFGRVAVGPSLGIQNSLADVVLDGTDKTLVDIGTMGIRYGLSADYSVSPTWLLQLRAESLTGFEEDQRLQVALGIQQGWGGAASVKPRTPKPKAEKTQKPEKAKTQTAQATNIKPFTALKSGSHYFIHLGVTDSDKATVSYFTNKQLLALGVPLTATSYESGHRIFIGPLSNRDSIAGLKNSLSKMAFFRKSGRLESSEYKPPIHSVLPATGPYYYIELQDAKVARVMTGIGQKISGSDWFISDSDGTEKLFLGPFTSKEQTVLLAKSLKQDGYQLRAFVRKNLLQ